MRKVAFNWLWIALLGCGAAASAGMYEDAVLASGPRGYWRLGEPSGTTAADRANAVGAPQNGAQNGTYQGGIVLAQTGALYGDTNTAAGLDGASAVVDIADSLNPTSYTIELWAKPDVLRQQSMMVRTSGNPLGEYSHEILMYDAGGGVYRFAHYVYDGSAKDTRGTTAIVAGQWYYVVGTFAQNGTMQVYVNGVQEGTPTSVLTPWAGGVKYLLGSQVGAATFGARSFFDGTLDDVALYDRALTATEIQAHYFAAIPEPGTLTLGFALAALVAARRRR